MQHARRRRLGVFNTGRCTCGLRWPCADANAWPINVPIPDGSPGRPSPYRPAFDPGRANWNDRTAAYSQVGRAGRLTLAQEYRAMGGRR